MNIERKVESSNRFRTGREGIKRRDLEKKYPLEKAQRLIEMLRKKNLWYWDDDFPGDEEERVFEQSKVRNCQAFPAIYGYQILRSTVEALTL